ncbi:MAG: bifunctional precorrin-2 dehydrogenase/sirohydrochlorin ferrochelatase [Candidatus Omnitrophica bacterium]|nr:bifunctional precorrin-2 dehydrogenase/sirohydrochlorin ferrochelatase [Candidatus Omnitrophota bacterium]
MYYPIFLNLRGRSCLVIGKGIEARRKSKALREAGAKVSVVSKPPARLEKFFLVVAATNNPAWNRQISKMCFRQNKLVNVVDVPGLCNFIHPSRFRQGPLQIAVSTGGASPALARHIRETVQKNWGKSWGRLLEFLKKNRRGISKKMANTRFRRKIFSLVQAGRIQEAKKELMKELS